MLNLQKLVAFSKQEKQFFGEHDRPPTSSLFDNVTMQRDVASTVSLHCFLMQVIGGTSHPQCPCTASCSQAAGDRTSHPQCPCTASCLQATEGTSHPQCPCTASCFMCDMRKRENYPIRKAFILAGGSSHCAHCEFSDEPNYMFPWLQSRTREKPVSAG